MKELLLFVFILFYFFIYFIFVVLDNPRHRLETIACLGAAEEEKITGKAHSFVNL